MTVTAPVIQEDTASIRQLESLVSQAMSGDETTLPAIRALIDQAPALWDQAFSITTRVEQSWIAAIAQQDLLTRETLTRQVESLKMSLAAESHSPLEELIIETICTCFLAYKQAELAAAERIQHYSSLTGQQETHLTACQRRYLTSIRELARLRQLLSPSRPTILNIAHQQQVNMVA